MVRYHQNGAIVQELINGKVVSGQCKDHPEFPGNADMKLYRCWVEDYEVNESRHSSSVSHIREAEGSYGYESTPRLDQQQGNGNGRGGNGANPKPKPKPKAKKEKSEDQLCRAAVVKVNANLLEISTWQCKLQAAGVAAVVATAFVDQMKYEAENLRKAKTALESALASGTATEQARKATSCLELQKSAAASVQEAKAGLDLARFPILIMRCALAIPDYTLMRIYQVIAWSFREALHIVLNTGVDTVRKNISKEEYQ
ncbi:unnamed protein product [Cladocopium goreaui]|uniref:Uncharacterized protein n=1 Tax=Cladocopium goreaui TaxID=2562237 RepID=A0A9P1BJF9_9DINO|nr:unnamed protein product [Cladocopium goreaui]